MATPSELEDRVASLEQEVAQLKEKVEGSAGNKSWIDRFSGAFKDDPDFEEIVRLGAEIRKAQRPETHG